MNLLFINFTTNCRYRVFKISIFFWIVIFAVPNSSAAELLCTKAYRETVFLSSRLIVFNLFRLAVTIRVVDKRLIIYHKNVLLNLKQSSLVICIYIYTDIGICIGIENVANCFTMTWINTFIGSPSTRISFCKSVTSLSDILHYFVFSFTTIKV